ncbi:MAG TPA: class I adenylate-forming enzyme family protein [Burkholderiales bacterium]|nr:class I adenylate-forming enzyme family protein [Burkholderiales bacterium]
MSGTLWGLIERRARDAPHAAAVLFDQDVISNRDFHQRSLSLARGLAGLGVRKGDVVAVQLPNIPEYLLSYAAICALGATLQPVHMPYRRAELATLLKHSETRVFLCLSRFKEESPAKEAVSLVEQVVALGEPVDGTRAFLSLTAGPRLERVAEGSPDDRFLLLYTSGTTDNPKGVPHAQLGFLANAMASVPEMEVTREEIILSAAPLTHLYGLYAYHLSLCSGAAMSLLPAFTPAGLAEVMQLHKANCVFAGPAHFKPLADGGLLERHDFSSLRFACLSGSPVPPELAAAVEKKLPRGRTLQLWGMTELQAGSFSRPRDPADVRHGTAGAATPGTELRVVGERLQVRGISLFKEYLKNERATREAFTADGWFETGDTAELSPAGHLRFTGRVKEIINRGGVKYSPLDVEAIIDRMPGVARSAIVPYPDPALGERACVFVQPAPGAARPTLEAITRELDRAGMAKFKWPERLELIEAMPITPTQKVMCGRLRELLSR